jgi:hypothetical protein
VRKSVVLATMLVSALPRSQIESGFKRHLSEMKLQFADQGYVILPDSVTPTSSQNPSGMDVVAKLAPGV